MFFMAIQPRADGSPRELIAKPGLRVCEGALTDGFDARPNTVARGIVERT